MRSDQFDRRLGLLTASMEIENSHMIHINICSLINLFLPLMMPYETSLYGDDKLCVVFPSFFFNFHGKHSSDILSHSMIRNFIFKTSHWNYGDLVASLELFQMTNRVSR
jgi:hypothetical protein